MLTKVWQLRIYWLFMIFLIIVDLAGKEYIKSVLAPMPVTQTVTSFFNLTTVWNYGVSFGLFSNHPLVGKYLILALSLGIVGFLLHWLYKETSQFTRWALITVVGGALGNIIDRIVHGAVFDFLDFHLYGYHWPAFNFADCFISIGVALLLWDAVFRHQKVKRGTE